MASNKKVFKTPEGGWNRTIINVALVAVVFIAGVAVGSDRINFGPDAVFRKSIQQSSGNLNYSEVDQVYESLQQGFDGQLDTQKLQDGLKAGLVEAAGDEYTEYFNPEEAQDFNEQLSGSFEGIGAELGKEEQAIVIISPIEGFPADKAGIKARDIISEINGESAYDISVNDAVKKIRGEKGTKVKLQVVRDGKPLDFEITRDTINLPSVETEITEGNIGIIKISRFGEDTTQLVTQAAEEFKEKNVKGVVLDMRGNPGGLLDSAVDVSELWLDDDQLILEEKRGDQVVKSFRASGNPVLGDVPTVVLIDEGSASASEIVAGALRDNNAATIIGQKSYGKGSVQEVRQLDDGGILKVTIARWYTPSGRNIDKEGIEPDQKVEITEEDVKAEKDPQQDAALQKLRQ